VGGPLEVLEAGRGGGFKRIKGTRKRLGGGSNDIISFALGRERKVGAS